MVRVRPTAPTKSPALQWRLLARLQGGGHTTRHMNAGEREFSSQDVQWKSTARQVARIIVRHKARHAGVPSWGLGDSRVLGSGVRSSKVRTAVFRRQATGAAWAKLGYNRPLCGTRPGEEGRDRGSEGKRKRGKGGHPPGRDESGSRVSCAWRR